MCKFLDVNKRCAIHVVSPFGCKYFDCRLTCLYEDAEGALWIGTENAGVMRYARDVFTTFTTKDGLPDNQVSEIRLDNDGGLQIATMNGFAFWRGNQLEPDPDKTDRNKVRRYFAPSGALWTLDQAGLIRFKDGRKMSYPPLIKPNQIHIASFYEDRQQNLWVGATTTALFKIKDGVVTQYSQRDGMPVEVQLGAIYEDRNGAIWIGTAGRGVIHLKDGRITVYTKQDGLSNNDVRHVFEDREGNIWVGTNGGGVNRMRRQFITTYSTQNGLYDNNVYPIYQDRAGAIWIGAGGSLSRFAGGKIINYTEKDVLGSRFHLQSLCEDREGRIWVGSYGDQGWLKDGTEVQLVIQDDGQGFIKSSGPLGTVWANTGELGRGGFGLLGMAERVRLMGGVYSLDSAPGKGTTITIKLAIPTNGYEKRDSNPDRR